MGTHLKVLSESYPMNTNTTAFRWLSKICASVWTRVARLSIGRVKAGAHRGFGFGVFYSQPTRKWGACVDMKGIPLWQQQQGLLALYPPASISRPQFCSAPMSTLFPREHVANSQLCRDMWFKTPDSCLPVADARGTGIMG